MLKTELVGQGDQRFCSKSRQRRLLLVLLIQLLIEVESLPQRFLESSVDTTTTAPNSTAVDPCPGAESACDCANLNFCGWKAVGNGGGGQCFNVGADAVYRVECAFCPYQSSCSALSCSSNQSPCSCATAAGCRWDPGLVSDNCIRATNGAGTPCSVCPAQDSCKIDPPSAVGFYPLQGGSIGLPTPTSRALVTIMFDRDVRWCFPSAQMSEVTFWCVNMVNTEEIPRSAQVALATSNAKRMVIDISSNVASHASDGPRVCGISIAPGVICDAKYSFFAGLDQGAYTFKIVDSTPPQLEDYQPKNDGSTIGLNDGVTLFYSENMKLNPAAPTASLGRLETDSSWKTTVVQSSSFPLQSPYVRISQKNVIFTFGDLLSAGRSYTLVLPKGAFLDLSGNPCEAMIANLIVFRVGTSDVQVPADTAPSGGKSVVVVIIVVVLVVVVVLAGGIGGFWLWRVHSQRVRVYFEGAPVKFPGRTVVKPEQSSLPNQPTVSGSPTFAQGSREPESSTYGASQSVSDAAAAAKATTATAYRAASGRDSSNAKASTEKSSAGNGTQPAAENGFWAQRTPGPRSAGSASNAPTAPKPQPKISRDRPHASTPQGPPSAPKVSPPPEPQGPPEVRAVEKQLRNLMDKPIAERKKAFKELLVEYHPDKNSADYAKEVFQYVNNARGWFLAEN